MKHQMKYNPLVQTVLQYVKRKRLLHTGDTVIAAVSGGVDSMVMLDLLVQMRGVLKLKIAVAHVNYQLRGKESNGDEQFVKQAAKRYGLPFYYKRTETKAEALRLKRSVQETAREIRYSFFDTVKKTHGADIIGTAHHADDNVETMLINLLRGSGIEGIAGIPPRRGAIVRPLLCVTRAEIMQYAQEQGVKFRNDSTNAGDDYTRNFLRNRIVPLLQQRINPSLNETMAHESELFRSMSDFAHQETDKAYRKVVKGTEIDLKKVAKVHPFIQQSVIRRLLKELKLELTFSNISSIIELMALQKGSVVEIQKEWVAERLSESIAFKKQTVTQLFQYTVEKEGRCATDEFVFTVKKSVPPDNKQRRDSSREYVDAAVVTFPLIIRTWNPGDFFVPLGMKGKKKLSDFFGEQKLTAEEKARTPVVETGGKIMWIAGKRIDDRFKVTDSTTSTYQLTIKRNGKKNDHR